jgi:hypothetical protein
MTTALATTNRFDEMKQFAIAMVESKFIPDLTWQQAMVLGMFCEAEDVPFVIGLRDYHVIKNKPVLKTEAMLARFQKAGGRVNRIRADDEEASAEFSHPQAGTLTISWNMERAKRSGLAGKENWQKWPRQMLKARVLSEGIRATYPGATGGALAPEEAEDLPGNQIERDVTPSKPLTGVAALKARVGDSIPQGAAVAHHTPTPADVAPPLTTDILTGEIIAAEQSWSYAEVSDAIQKAVAAKDSDALLVAVDLLRYIADEHQRAELDVEARAAWKAIKKAA